MSAGESRAYRGTGSASYHPAMLLGLLVYGYATKVFSSRELERATHDSVAFRFIAGNEHPDHDTIATFRKRFLAQIEALFVRCLEAGARDGHAQDGHGGLWTARRCTPTRAGTARSRTGMRTRSREQLKAEVSSCCGSPSRRTRLRYPDGMSIPEELERREVRLAGIAEAKAKIEARAKERLEREQAEHQSQTGGACRAKTRRPARSQAASRPHRQPAARGERSGQSDG